jgi:two-component system response regulator YesN
MELAAERFKESVRRTAGCVVSIFFGEIAEADGLNVAYRKLNATARRTAGDETGVIVLADSLRETGLPHAGYSRLESLYMTPELVALLSNLDLRGSLARIELIFAEAEQRARLSDRAVWLEIYHVVSGAVIQASLQQGFSLSQWLSGNEPLLDPVRLDTRLAELKGWCRSIVNAFVGQMSNREKLQSNRLLEQTKRIVEEQYARDLTVAEIAAYLYVHPSYLTRVFKAGTGMSLIDYISRRRIEEAKLYLAQPGYKVYEVAGKVGYESIAHFNRMFKRETGMSPKDYQKTVALP